MSTRHCTDDVLIAKLYGLEIDAEKDLHLSDCRLCVERLNEMTQQKNETAAVGMASDEFLRGQRVRIQERIERHEGRVWWLRPAPAVAAALMIAAGLMLRPPAPSPAPAPPPSESDAQFFSEIATVADQQAPRAADPIRGLFDEAVEQ